MIISIATENINYYISLVSMAFGKAYLYLDFDLQNGSMIVAGILTCCIMLKIISAELPLLLQKT